MIAAALAASSAARADPPAGDASPQAEAERLFDEGKARQAKDDWATSCALFDASARLYEVAPALVKVARCRAHEGRFAAAIEVYERALALAPWPELDRLVRAELFEIEKRTPKIRVTLVEPASGVTVRRNGRPLAPGRSARRSTPTSACASTSSPMPRGSAPRPSTSRRPPTPWGARNRAAAPASPRQRWPRRFPGEEPSARSLSAALRGAATANHLSHFSTHFFSASLQAFSQTSFVGPEHSLAHVFSASEKPSAGRLLGIAQRVEGAGGRGGDEDDGEGGGEDETEHKANLLHGGDHKALLRRGSSRKARRPRRFRAARARTSTMMRWP